MTAPTQEQIKELWEWCGFKLVPKFGGTDMTDTLWLYPDGSHHEQLPPIDLNSLFKYAVPKLPLGTEVNLIKYNGRVSWDRGVTWYEGEYFDCELTLPDDREMYGSGEDPALALFWAIWEVINDRRKMPTL